jgi:hypothetical protein
MASDAPIYQKLPGRGMRKSAFAVTATRCRLWLAQDHVLAIDKTVASEEYRRFYFRDIEAFIIRRTASRQIWNWVLLVLILITAGPFVLAWRSEGSGGFLITAISVGAFWGIFLLVNTLRGPTCRTHIRTAVQTEELPSLGRLPVARKVLARLQPLIVAAQGAATPEEMSGAPWMAGTGASPGGPLSAGPKPLRDEKGRFHVAVFGLLIAEAALAAVAWIMTGDAFSVFSMLAMLGGCILCIIALVRQADSNLPSSVRTMTKVAIGYYLLKVGIGFVFMVIFSVRNPGTPVISGLEVVGEPGFSETTLVTAGLAAVVGLLGFIALLSHFRRPAAAPAT